MTKPSAASVRPLRAEPGPGRARGTTRWLALGLLVLTAAVYAPVRHHGFVTLDDPVYVTQNRHVQAGLTLDGIGWALTSPHDATWHPLTSLSHMLDCQLFGLNPGAHHLGNVVLHVLNTLLLFGLLVRTTARPWPSACVAALFGLHPLHVESVAWVAERKDVLSTAFWLLTVWAYVEYVQRPDGRRYALVLAAYAAALLSKPMVVTLPVVLLLLDIWPLRRWGSGDAGVQRSAEALVREKVPLLLMAAFVGAITVLVQWQTGATTPALWPSFTDRAANALVSYAAYLGKMVWPSPLAVFYPFEPGLPAVQVLAAAALLTAVTALVVWQRQRRYLLIGWLWYLVTLTPVIGLLPVGDQAMADRFTYVPLIGIFIMLAWGLPDLLAHRLPRQAICAVAGVSAVVACLILTSRQLERWRDNRSLFEHALSVTRNNFVAHYCLGLTALDQERHDDAAAHFAASRRIRPTYVPARYAMGRLLAADGDLEAAKLEFLEAVQLNPADAKVYVQLARVFAKQDNLDVALDWIRRGIEAAPDNPEVHFELGVLSARAAKWGDALTAQTTALSLYPGYVEARLKLADILLTVGRYGHAIQEYTTVLQADPANGEAHDHLGLALMMEKRLDEAARAFRDAVALMPDFAPAHNHWGVVLSMQGRYDEAIERFREALRHDPGYADAQFNLTAAENDRAAGPRSPAP